MIIIIGNPQNSSIGNYLGSYSSQILAMPEACQRCIHEPTPARSGKKTGRLLVVSEVHFEMAGPHR